MRTPTHPYTEGGLLILQAARQLRGSELVENTATGELRAGFREREIKTGERAREREDGRE